MNYIRKADCSFCKGKLIKVVSLGKIPPVNFFPTPSQVSLIKKYALELVVCSKCELLQLSTILKPEKLFKDYHYLTSASKSLVKDLAELATYCISEFNLGKNSRILDIGSNDGSFLQNFSGKSRIILGIDPSKEAGLIARKKGIVTKRKFFDLKTAKNILKKYGRFNLIASIHNLANILDLNNFLAGIKLLLNPAGILVIEVADGEKMIQEGRFDSLYHEHYNYFSLPVLKRILGAHGLAVFKVKRNLKQGGSFRVFAKHAEKLSMVYPDVRLKKYQEYAKRVEQGKSKLLKVFAGLKGKTVIGIGASAKAVVLANLLGLNQSNITFITDSTIFKLGKLLPGTDIPVAPEAHLQGQTFQFAFIFAWNYQTEIISKLKKYAPLKVIIPFPELKILNLQNPA